MSTTDCILNFLKKLYDSRPENKFSIGISIDLCKAFDSVNHNILLEKLKFYGVRNKSQEWFQSYLSGRQQFTVCNNYESSLTDINVWLPQGSIVGQLLFLFFINDIVHCSDLLHLYLFTDDGNALISGNTLENLRTRTQVELEKIHKWLVANKIKANLKKSHFLVFKGCKRLDHSLLIKFNGKSLSQKHCTKMLGVWISDNLKWDEHINVINGKISKINGILFKLSKIMNSKTLKLIYNSLIYPHLQYANVVWGNAPEKLLKICVYLRKERYVPSPIQNI